MTTPDALPRCVRIVGTGLIGTSIGMALRAAGYDVVLHDPDARALQHAVDLGAGRIADDAVTAAPDLVVICAPPDAVSALVADALAAHPDAVVTDVASLKARIVRDVTAAAGPDAARYVGGHPLAGRETSGPSGARTDLFEGRPWVLATDDALEGAVAKAEELVRACGAVPVRMSAADHDAAVAAVSHVPQLMASLTAARLQGLDEQALALSGQGVRDVTRIAASDPALWGQIVAGNADAVLEVLDSVAADLDALRDALAEDPAAAARQVHRTVAQGNAGRAAIPGKHGGSAQRYASVPVVIPDRSGSLARLFDEVGRLGVNIEDLVLEHSPGQPVGLVTLSVLPSVADGLRDDLERHGWTVHR